MTDKLTSFLTRNHASREVLSRLAATGAATPEETWARANARDLVWAVTRPGVMSDDQRRRFLSEAVLAPIEHLLTDERSKNILQKLRTNEPITAADRWAASQAAEAAADAADAASWAASWAAASWAAASQAAAAVAKAEDADASWASDASYAAARAAWSAAREAQARWLRNNFVLTDLNIK